MQNKIKRLLFTLIVAFCFACSPGDTVERPNVLKGNAQGTTFSIKYFGEEIPNSIQDIDSIFHEMDRCFSLWEDSSIITRWNNCNSDLFYFSGNRNISILLDKSHEINDATDNAFNPALHPIISAWGFSKKKGISPTKEKIDSLLVLTDFENFNYQYTIHAELSRSMALTCHEGSIDFNAIAQGYTVDVIAQYLDAKICENYFIEVGGETFTKGLKPDNNKWVITIDKPSGKNLEHIPQDTVYISNKALVSSGSHRKVVEIDGKKYSHTIDPSTGYPVQHQLLSATVIADECADADAYATAFMVMGVEKTIEFVNSTSFVDGVYLIFEENGEMKTYISDGFKPFLKP